MPVSREQNLPDREVLAAFISQQKMGGPEVALPWEPDNTRPGGQSPGWTAMCRRMADEMLARMLTLEDRAFIADTLWAAAGVQRGSRISRPDFAERARALAERLEATLGLVRPVEGVVLTVEEARVAADALDDWETAGHVVSRGVEVRALAERLEAGR